MKLLVDGDVIAYRAAFASEKAKYAVQDADVWRFFDDAKSANEHKGTGVCIWTRKEVAPVEQAILIADVMLKDIREHHKAVDTDVTCFLSGVGNYRYGIASRASYKGNRSGSVPPVHLKAVREHLISRGATVSAGEEADDLIGIAATAEPDSIVCSIDKDLMQLPGRHYNFVTKEEVTVSKKESVLNLYTQVIAGDSVDNVLGCKGMGPVKARKALEGCKHAYECWRTALDVYGEVYGAEGPRFALETASLVYVRRKPGEFFVPPVSNRTSNADATKAA